MEFNLYTVRVFVENWDRAIEFYEETMQLECVFKDKDMGWAQYKVGGAHLGIERTQNDSEQEQLVGRFVGVSLMVKDIDQAYQELLARGAAFIGPPQKQLWGGVLAHLKDPEGNVLTLLGE
jgi:predicted enzyme related to lactoylglutathione lyase